MEYDRNKAQIVIRSNPPGIETRLKFGCLSVCGLYIVDKDDDYFRESRKINAVATDCKPYHGSRDAERGNKFDC